MSGLYRILLVLFLLASVGAFAQVPPNIGFEKGTFEGWICSTGSINANGDILVGGTQPVYNQHTIVGVKTYDKYGNFPTLCPNGSKFSVRLGNDRTGAEAERISYQFVVPPGLAYSLVLNYAVVLQNPGHESYQQPKFAARIYDYTDSKYITCPYFDFVASNELPGFKISNVAPDVDSTRNTGPSTISYKEWSATTINLAGYGGKTVVLEFTTNDCTKGGHFGYAYIDINEEGAPAITGSAYCDGQLAITLHAPNGFYGYKWFKDNDFTQSVGDGETLTLNPAPPNLTKYAVAIAPYTGLGCPDTLYTVVNKIEENFILNLVDTVYACQGAGADLTAAYVTAGTSDNTTFKYYTNPVTLDYVYNPKSVETGTYYIHGINAEGCENILPVHVVLKDAPLVKMLDPLPVQYPQTVDLSRVYQPVSGQTYSYYTDSVATIPVADYKNISASGKYYIKAVNTIGCTTITSTAVLIKPPAAYKILAPNIFTPNNDGVNDHFSVQIDGFVSFGNVKIFNRYGQMVFTANSTYDVWDGNYKGQALPPGAYYWVFEGTDLYYHTKVTKAASITIVR
ncbi:gliding motility-associated C-terminal domain-containing protein [Mucilaginibacter sp.]|uniref:gliding motility-associated C-terminal domain-containing protein n=1 Tax=Mucilaginibacter sp. TaxID=1882438 RepID=UPI0026363CD9|nr:gliding motility-associated C-terminal domain-containing protein [Mucilaginibacter sp.]